MKRLIYISDKEPGITRIKSGNTHHYFYLRKRIKDDRTLNRITSLKIPPAYKKVWICKSSRGHIQATGYDDEGRKQYVYHKRWQDLQNKKKFHHLADFGKVLPKIRRKINNELRYGQFSKEKIICTIVKLLDVTSIRIGSPQYKSYGLLTIKKNHIQVKGSNIVFDFEGKSKQHWHLDVDSKALAKIIKKCEQLPGQRVFKYLDTNKIPHYLTVQDINHYLKSISGEDITAKEFRTWKASVLYLHYIQRYQNPLSEVTQRICVEKVAKVLVNTPRICKNSYIHPVLFATNIKLSNNNLKPSKYLSIEEKYFLKMLNKKI